MSVTELTETRMSWLKHSLENWREVVLRTESVLTWEQDWYPAVTSGIVTAFYLFVWWWDPTFITFLAFSGLLLAVADYVGPKIINQVFGSNSWTGAKEKKYEQICESLVHTTDQLESFWGMCRDARHRKPILHFVATILALFTVAWVGNRVNNFFLAYLLTTGALMLPGLQKKGYLKQFAAQATLKLGEVMKGKDYLKKAQ